MFNVLDDRGIKGSSVEMIVWFCLGSMQPDLIQFLDQDMQATTQVLILPRLTDQWECLHANKEQHLDKQEYQSFLTESGEVVHWHSNVLQTFGPIWQWDVQSTFAALKGVEEVAEVIDVDNGVIIETDGTDVEIKSPTAAS